jgi:hydrogenase nickel incorporation protein HypA/HybF
MHELSVTTSILEIALRHARAAGATRITDLHLVIGQLSSIVDDSVQFYWDIVSENTLAAGSRLHFRRIPGELTCLDCGMRYAPGSADACLACGSARAQITAGEEFYLDSIEVEGAVAESGGAEL